MKKYDINIFNVHIDFISISISTGNNNDMRMYYGLWGKECACLYYIIYFTYTYRIAFDKIVHPSYKYT